MREAGITLGIIGSVIVLLIGLYLAAVGVLVANEVGDRDTFESYTMLFNLEKDAESVIDGNGKLIGTGVITLIVAIVGIVGAVMGKSQNLASWIMLVVTSVIVLFLFILALSFWSGSYPVYLIYLLGLLMVGGGAGLVFAGGMVEKGRSG